MVYLPWWFTRQCLPTMLKTQVQSLGREDLLEKETATHSSVLAQKIPWVEDSGRLQSMGRKEQDRTERLHFHCYLLEKEMATHSSTLAWKIPWTEEPGRLQSMGSQSWTQLSNFSFTFLSTKFIVFTISSLEPSSPNPLSNWIDSFYSINTSKFPQYTCMSRDPPTHCPFTER